MAAAGKFVLLSEDKVIVFSEQIRTRKPNEKRLKRFQEILKTWPEKINRGYNAVGTASNSLNTWWFVCKTENG